MKAICRIFRCFAAIGSLLAPAVVQAADLPATPAGREFAAWLDVFNAGRAPAIVAFAKQHFPAQSSAGGRWNSVRDQSGGFIVDAIEDSSDTRITALLHERAQDRNVRAIMDVQADAPHRIVQFSLQIVGPRAIPRSEAAATAPAAAPEPAPLAAPRDAPRIAVPLAPAATAGSEADAIAAIRAEAERAAAAGQFSGAVMIARDGRTVFATAYGDADRTQHLANTVDTRFRIGSMNKMFTATAIMQLVQAGKVKIEEPFGKYLADYPNRSVANTVTIHQLLTHTGGTGDFLGPEYAAHRQELKNLKDYIALFGKRETSFPPGSQFAYSNFGYIVLGRVIEAVSGKSYDDYVREHIFVPADMSATDSVPEDEAATLPDRSTPAGGGTSTVQDLINFADALASHKLLDAETTALMTTGKVEMAGPHALYGYGFGDITEGTVRHFGHNGGAPGMNGDLSIFPRSGYEVAVLADMDPPSASHLAAVIAAKLPVQ